jgi:hypothetical protein
MKLSDFQRREFRFRCENEWADLVGWDVPITAVNPFNVPHVQNFEMI